VSILLKSAAILILCLSSSVAKKTLDSSAIDAYLKPYVQSGNFSGNVLIERGRKVIFEKSYGFANQGRNP
jgi:hypothetical protein